MTIEDVVALVARLRRERGDDVVRLEARRLDDRDAQRLDDLAHETHLLAEDVGRRVPVGLVVGDRFVAERRLGPVERNADAVGLVVADEVQQHRREPEHRVGHLPGSEGDVGRQREERSVRERVPVDQHQLCHCLQPMDESRDVSGEAGVLGRGHSGCATRRSASLRGDVRTVLQRPDLHLLRPDREHDRVGLGQPAQGLALAPQPEILRRDRGVGVRRRMRCEQLAATRGSSSSGASSPPAAASDRGTCRPSSPARLRSEAPARGSPTPAAPSCPRGASATGSTRTPPPAPVVRRDPAAGRTDPPAPTAPRARADAPEPLVDCGCYRIANIREQFGARGVGIEVRQGDEDLVALLGEELLVCDASVFLAAVVGHQPLGLVDAAEPHRQPRRPGRDERQLVEPRRRGVRAEAIRR